MKYNKINLMCPTYHRLKKLTTFIQSAQSMCNDRKCICFTFCVNKSDRDTVSLIGKLCQGWDYHIVYENLSKPNLAIFYNMMYTYSSSYDSFFRSNKVIVSMLGDDMEFKTKGYDTFLIDEINQHNGIGIFYGNDNIHKKNMCSNIFTTRKFVDGNLPKLFMCELFPCDVIDRLWFGIAKKLNCLYYYPDIKIQHNHASRSGVGNDKTHSRLMKMRGISMKHNRKSGDIIKSSVSRIIKNLCIKQ